MRTVNHVFVVESQNEILEVTETRVHARALKKLFKSSGHEDTKVVKFVRDGEIR